jgi:hypothetical protein
MLIETVHRYGPLTCTKAEVSEGKLKIQMAHYYMPYLENGFWTPKYAKIV